MKTFRVALVLSWVLTAGGCTDKGPSAPPAPDPIPRLVPVTYEWTLGVPGTEATPAPEVRVVDQYGAPHGGKLVTFELVAGGGVIEGASVLSDASGHARLGRWVLGDEPGENIVNARLASSPATAIEFRVTAHRPCAAPCEGARRVAFVRQGNIYVANADGSDVVQLTSTGGAADPAWSPDGSQIAFTQTVADQQPGRERRIYLIRSDGSGLRHFAEGLEPAWSPDGGRIAYGALDDGQWRIFVKSVTDAAAHASPIGWERGFNHAPAWSPDGERIAFVSDWAGFDFARDVYLVNPDGSDIVQITRGFTGSSWTIYDQPVWSPDGLTLALVACAEQQYYTCENSQVGLINRDGTGYRTLATTTGFARPGWTPDGDAVTFARTCWEHDCNSHVFMRSIQGGTEHLLIPDAHSLAWRP